MTPDERKMLTDLANKVAQTPAPPKDAEAEDLIRTQIGRRPDALYLMTQTVLIQNLALEHAQDEIRDLQQQVQQGTPARQSGSGGSFLGSSQGGGYQQSSYAQQAAQPQYAPAPQYAPVPQYAPSGGAPGFLRGAAQTAAGVAAGALAFEGIRSLFSHPGFGGNELGGFGGGGGMAPEVINNYYETGSPHEQQNERFSDTSGVMPADNFDASAQDVDTSADINNADAFDDSSQDDYTDDSGSDDSSSDDNS